MFASLKIAWRPTRAARRQAPSMLLFLQVSPGGTNLIAKRYTLQFSTGFVVIAWRSNTIAKRYTNTCAILVFKHAEQSKINLSDIYSPFKSLLAFNSNL